MQEMIDDTYQQYVKLQSSGVIRFATLSEIVYLKADDNYTCCVLNDRSEFTVCQTLLNFELMLGAHFFRCHKSYLINTFYIKEIHKRSHQLILTTGCKLPFSRNKVKMLEEKLKVKTFTNSGSSPLAVSEMNKSYF